MDNFWSDADIISKYTLEDQIADGTKTEFTELAQDAGIVWRVLATQSLVHDLTPSEKDYGQSLEGRMWDVFTIFRIFARANADKDLFTFKISLLHDNIRAWYYLQVLLTVDETGAPVLVFGTSEEDMRD